jgi:hypothetical protein
MYFFFSFRQDGRWTVGNWRVDEYSLVYAKKDGQPVIPPRGTIVRPVVIVAECKCEQELTKHAPSLMRYADGASTLSVRRVADTSDSENPMSSSRYEERMAEKRDACLGLKDFIERKTSSQQGNNPVSTNVSYFYRCAWIEQFSFSL